jgi:small subunit ribosomal protein S4
MLNLWLQAFDLPKSLHIVRRFPRPSRSEIHAEQRQTTKEPDEQARQFQVQARPPRRRKSLGPSQEPGQQALHGPGQHGQRRAKKLSDYGTQLQAKQKLKGYYGNITERQFRKYYQDAARRPGDTGENMIGLLETRLDTVVFRSKFVPTPFAARQLVSHGHVKVNGRRVTIASYHVKDSDTIELSPKAREMALVLEASKSAERDTPDYLEVHEGKTAKLLRTPKLADVPFAVQMSPHLIVEFYSR